MRTSLDAFYHIKRVSFLPQGRGEYGRTFMNALSRKDRKILVEDSKKILEGQRPIRVYFEDFREFVKEIKFK